MYLPYHEEREDNLGQVKQLVLYEADCQTVAFQVIHEEVYGTVEQEQCDHEDDWYIHEEHAREHDHNGPADYVGGKCWNPVILVLWVWCVLCPP